MRRRRLFFSTELFFAISKNLVVHLGSSFRSAVRLAEREIESGDQRTGFFVGFSGGADDDIHAPYTVDLVIVDFRENDVFLDANRIVAVAIEAAIGNAAEVAHTRERDVDEPVEELI